MQQYRTNPFVERGTYSTSYIHTPYSSHYFPSTHPSESKIPSFMLGREAGSFPEASGFVESPFHDYRALNHKSQCRPKEKYQQNPFHRGHLL